MNGDFELPYGVTLYFQGGYLFGNGKLIGNHTRIVAPIEQIFYNDSDEEAIIPEGTWDIEVAYPHWFGMKTFKELWEGDNLDNITDFSKYDCAPAINKAIKMKRCGTVFIPMGRFIIDTTIYVEPGIILLGEAVNNGTQVGPQAEQLEYGTHLYTMTGAKYGNGYVLKFNTNNNEFDNHISQGSIIKNISFVNCDSDNPYHKCIYTRGGFEINNCVWDRFAQAVESCFDYSDFKKNY